jgi:hypothetical protein
MSRPSPVDTTPPSHQPSFASHYPLPHRFQRLARPRTRPRVLTGRQQSPRPSHPSDLPPRPSFTKPRVPFQIVRRRSPASQLASSHQPRHITHRFASSPPPLLASPPNDDGGWTDGRSLALSIRRRPPRSRTTAYSLFSPPPPPPSSPPPRPLDHDQTCAATSKRSSKRLLTTSKS